MSQLIKKVKDQQRTIQDLQKEAARKQGRKEQLLKQLKSEFDVNSPEEAETLLAEFKEVKKQNVESLENISKKLEKIISSAQAAEGAVN